MMSLSLCSILRPSRLIFEPDCRLFPKSNQPLRFDLQRIASINYCRCIRATQDGIGVLSPDDTVSLRKSVTEEEEVVDGAVNEVEIADVEEKVPSSLERTEKKKEDERYRDDSRYKLRNGREVFEEKAFLVGVARKGDKEDSFGIEESLKELAQLADTAGLMVVDSTYQKLATPNPKTYIGSGKVAEIKTAVDAFDVETVIFDDELSPGQLRNLEKVFGGKVRVCDRTALILDIFNQCAATREAALQANCICHQLKLCLVDFSHAFDTVKIVS